MKQQKKPFPVVNIRFRPVTDDHPCASRVCQSLEFLPEPPKGAFAVQSCMGERGIDKGVFTEKELGEILWEKAYHEQLSGKEPEALAYPICAQCTAFTIMKFLNQQDEQEAMIVMAVAITKGQTIILFDRNLSRDRIDPACGVGPFETLADFRRYYWNVV